jgi:hypothetical protein
MTSPQAYIVKKLRAAKGPALVQVVGGLEASALT